MPICRPPQPSSKHSSQPFPIASTLCSPTTESSSPICRRIVEGLRQDGVDIPSIAPVFVIGIRHRLTQPSHPWTNGQVERMNRTIKEATVKRFFYDTHEQLKAHLSDFIAAYNFARRLKTLRGLTPYEAICKLWTHDPDRFTLDPIHQMPGLNT